MPHKGGTGGELSSIRSGGQYRKGIVCKPLPQMAITLHQPFCWTVFFLSKVLLLDRLWQSQAQTRLMYIPKWLTRFRFWSLSRSWADESCCATNSLPLTASLCVDSREPFPRVRVPPAQNNPLHLECAHKLGSQTPFNLTLVDPHTDPSQRFAAALPSS